MDQHAGIDSSFSWCETGGRIKLDNEYMVLLGSSITAQDVTAELVQPILGGGRIKVCSVQQKPKA